MKPRLVDRIQGKYRPAEFAGNNSGVSPLGKKILVMTDEFEGTFAGGELVFIQEQIERMNLASESGVIIALGSEAFSHHADGTRWVSRRPEPGEHVYFEKYAGLLVMGNDGKPRRIKSGELERQGFSDQDYLWQIQIRHLYEPARTNTVTGKLVPQRWGLQIMKCKANNALIGEKLWGSDCNFPSLVQTVYPHIPLSNWGY